MTKTKSKFAVKINTVHPSNLHQLQDAILSIWANISKECFQHLDESMPCTIKAVLKAEQVKHSISMVFLIILKVSVIEQKYRSSKTILEYE